MWMNAYMTLIIVPLPQLVPIPRVALRASVMQGTVAMEQNAQVNFVEFR